MERRGPDHFAAADLSSGVTFTHSRLSIIDLESGAQPMARGGNSIVFNGEIYNFRELRHEGSQYATSSDTEVLLDGLNREGIDFLERVDGMFAFAFFDRAHQQIVLARDLFGIKPLYYVVRGEQFAFASRLQPLMLLSEKIVDPAALGEYYAGRACRGERTIFTDVKELRAGEVLIFDLSDFSVRSVRRWTPPLIARRAVSDEATALKHLEDALRLSVERHLVSDVPVATFLSGGVDSSLITALAAELNPDIAAFSIGFTDARFDESRYAAAVCRQYGLRHHVRYCGPKDFIGALEDWPEVMDDAVADPAAVMLTLVASFAREQGYKVVLSGEGADELFAGYNQYRRFIAARRLAAGGRFAPRLLPRAASLLSGGQTRYVQFAHNCSNDPFFYGTGRIFEPYLLPDLLRSDSLERHKAETLTEALALDLEWRLPDDMLTRTDRATMAASIETRVPFLTRYVWEASAELDDSLLIRGRTQKYLLKKLAEKFVPRECLYRRKVGFDLPLKDWLRGPMRTYMRDTLNSTWQHEFLRDGAIESVIDDHLTGRNDNADKIWAFLLLDLNVRALRSITLASFE